MALQGFFRPLLRTPCQQQHSWCWEPSQQQAQIGVDLNPTHKWCHHHLETFADLVEACLLYLPAQFRPLWLQFQLGTQRVLYLLLLEHSLSVLADLYVAIGTVTQDCAAALLHMWYCHAQSIST